MIPTISTAPRRTMFNRRPKPFGNRLVGAFFESAEPIKTKYWLAASPMECIVSANIATFPVKKNATPFMMAINVLMIAAVRDGLLPCFNNPKNSFIQIPPSLNQFNFNLFYFFHIRYFLIQINCIFFLRKRHTDCQLVEGDIALLIGMRNGYAFDK